MKTCVSQQSWIVSLYSSHPSSSIFIHLHPSSFCLTWSPVTDLTVWQQCGRRIYQLWVYTTPTFSVCERKAGRFTKSPWKSKSSDPPEVFILQNQKQHSDTTKTLGTITSHPESSSFSSFLSIFAATVANGLLALPKVQWSQDFDVRWNSKVHLIRNSLRFVITRMTSSLQPTGAYLEFQILEILRCSEFINEVVTTVATSS